MSQERQPLGDLQIQKWMQDIREQEPAQTFALFVAKQQTILNIGPSWGRDSYYLSGLGKRVINADIALQYHLDPLVICDVTKGLPFASQCFGAVLMSEVLEHLIEDGMALSEARRVMRDDGILALSVPFYNDEPEFHVRIHSPRSIDRLLRCTGFRATIYIERGGLITWPRLIQGARLIFRFLLRREEFNRIIVRFDHFLARRFKWLLRFSPYYGCYLTARKAEFLDYRNVNIEEFSH